jgi:hypothetical protein
MRIVRLSLLFAVPGGALLAAPVPLTAVVAKQCATCHRGAAAPAGLDLTALDLDLANVHKYNQWVRIHDAVRAGRMPPANAPTFDKLAFLQDLGASLTTQSRTLAASQGRSVLRRLNRYEYENTVRDLLSAPWLQLKDSVPEDGIVNRFNKSGQALDVSHVQMSRYMEVAEQALRDAMVAARARPQSTRQYARDQQRMISRMKYSPFNNHPERATIPILGFDSQPEVIALKAPVSVGAADPKTRELEGYATPASTYIGNEMHFDGWTAPAGGLYKLRFNAFSLWIHTHWVKAPGGKEMSWRPNRDQTSRGRTEEPVTIYAINQAREKRLLGTFDVSPEPGIHELTVTLLAGEQILPDASRLFRSRPGFIASPDATAEGMPGVAYRWMDVEGPIATPAARQVQRRLFGDLPLPEQGTAADGERLLRRFAQRAYRRPVREAETARYAAILKAKLANGGSFTEALIAAYTAVMCSPGFLYLEEQPGPLSSWALASRLSYFLWNAPPDEELRALAAKDALRQPGVLRTQARRLMNDARSRGFVNAFLDYWLDLRRLGETTPDQTLYPEHYLDDLLTESALLETQMFFDQMLRKNLPAATLVDSRFSILNSHLARHYGLPPVAGSAMRYMELPADSPRGGILTQASVLTVTANGTTTSPVLRGAWIMERILGEPPPPPPPGTPAVEPDTRGATTIRQQLDQHRSNPACASCHSRIDPPGFALESFDVVGVYRSRYRSLEQGDPVRGFGKNGHPFTYRYGPMVDASGKLNGQTFADVREFKSALLKDERKIARNLAAQLIAYGTGTAPGFADRDEVERILTAAGGRFGTGALIEQIVQSRLFLNK